MKILIYHPEINHDHELVKHLKAHRVGVLVPQEITSAHDLLTVINMHGKSIDLAIIHREVILKNDQDGLSIVKAILSDKTQSDLPILLTTGEWSTTQCAQHQSTSQGCHAYLQMPLKVSAILNTIDQVLGTALAKEPPALVTKTVVSPKNKKEVFQLLKNVDQSVPSIEVLEVSQLFGKSESSDHEEDGFELAPPTSDIILPSSASSMVPSHASKESGGIEISASEGSFELELSPSMMKSEDETSEEDSSEHDIAIEAAISPSASEWIPEESIQEQAPNELPEQHFEEPVHAISDSSFDLVSDSVNEESHESVSLAPTFTPAAVLPSTPTVTPTPMMAFSQPMGDAVVPGGAAHSPDLETLKNYLLLREHDVAALAAQLRTARLEVSTLRESLDKEQSRAMDFESQIKQQQSQQTLQERERLILIQNLEQEVDDLKRESKTKNDKTRLLEIQIKDTLNEMDRIKDRVKTDIRKIRVREKELENRLEIMKKDSEAMLTAREHQIIELKRKVDLLEFNLDVTQDQYSKEKLKVAELRDKLERAAQIVRSAGGLLFSSESISRTSVRSGHKHEDVA
jgi:hypothetical protein